MRSIHAVPADSFSARIRKIAVAGVILIWTALILGALGRFGWWLDLFAHFRVHYAVLFAALTAALVLAQARKAALVSFVGAAVSAIPMFSYVHWPVQPARADAETFRLASLNVWFRNHDYARLAAYLEQTGADVIVVQEAAEPAARKMHALLPSYPHAHFATHWHGAAVFSRWPLRAAESRPLAPSGSPGAYVQVDWRGVAVTLLGVHLHWPLGPGAARLRNQELDGLTSIAKAASGPTLVAGDFNVTPWSPRFQDAVTGSGLSDCAWGQGLAATWPSYIGWLGIRIDQCLASRHWRVIDLRIGPHVGSDHRPVIVDLALIGPTSSPANRLTATH